MGTVGNQAIEYTPGPPDLNCPLEAFRHAPGVYPQLKTFIFDCEPCNCNTDDPHVEKVYRHIRMASESKGALSSVKKVILVSDGEKALQEVANMGSERKLRGSVEFMGLSRKDFCVDRWDVLSNFSGIVY